MTGLLCVQWWDGQCEPCKGQSMCQDHPLAPGQGDEAPADTYDIVLVLQYGGDPESSTDACCHLVFSVFI